MSQVLDTIREFLAEEKLRFEEYDEVLFLRMADPNGKWAAVLREAHGALVCSAILPMNVPDERRAAAAELLTRLNWMLVVGNWEMDFGNGEVHFRASLPGCVKPVTVEMVREVCYTAFGMFSEGWEMVLAVIAGIEPQEAIDTCRRRERQRREEFESWMRKAGFEPEAQSPQPPPETPPTDPPAAQ